MNNIDIIYSVDGSHQVLPLEKLVRGEEFRFRVYVLTKPGPSI